MAVVTLPLDYSLVVYTGTTFRREFRWLADGTAPVDLTGWHAMLNIGQIGMTAVKTLTDTNGGVTLTATGQIILTMTPADTLLLHPGTMSWNLDLTSTDGTVRRFARGRISIVQDVKAAS